MSLSCEPLASVKAETIPAHSSVGLESCCYQSMQSGSIAGTKIELEFARWEDFTRDKRLSLKICSWTRERSTSPLYFGGY